MNLTSTLLGMVAGFLLGWGLFRLQHKRPGGWGFTLLGCVLLGASLTQGLWGRASW